MAQPGRDQGGTVAWPRRVEHADGRWARGDIIAGRYRLEHTIGEGGMSVVWRATQSLTQRAVALKFLRQGGRAPKARKRFLREARAAAAVHHPNVVEIYDVLELEGDALALVMELLPGESLAHRLERERRIPLPQAAAIMLQVAAAASAAHALGIIHRDIKPENIFVIEGDDMRAKVLDFGIAKLTADSGSVAQTMALTQEGAMLGTPCYMAPEQACGEPDIDHRADVWAIGLVLYQCLSGVLPTAADNLAQVFMAVMTATIPPLATLAPEIPAEVSALVEQMLTRDREARMADLGTVASVLARWAGVPAPLIDAPFAPRASRPGAAPLTPARVVAGDLDLGSSDACAPTERARVAALAPPLGNLKTEHLTPAPDTTPMPPLDPVLEDITLVDAIPPEHSVDEAAVLAAAAAALRTTGPPLSTLPSTSPCVALAFCPIGGLLATAHEDGGVFLWNPTTRARVRAFHGHKGCVYSLAISPDGARLVTGSADTTLRVFDAATGRCVFVFQEHSSPVRSVAVSPDGAMVVSAGGTSVRLWPITGGPSLRILKEPSALLRSVAISPDGQIIASGAPHGVISLWNAATGEALASWRAIRAPLRALAFHPRGQMLAACGDATVRIWGVASGRMLRALEGHTAPVRCLSWSADGTMLVTGGDDGALRLWSVAPFQLARVLEVGGGAVHSVAFHPDGQTLAVSTDKRAITLFRLP